MSINVKFIFLNSPEKKKMNLTLIDIPAWFSSKPLALKITIIAKQFKEMKFIH